LTGNAPYFKCNNTAILEKMRVGELPQKPHGIDDTVWEFLRKCWSRAPAERPPIAQVCNDLSKFCFLPKFTPTPEGQSTTELPGKVKLQVQSIKVSLDKGKQQHFFVKLKYGNKGHTTSTTKSVDASGEHTWFALRPFLSPLPLLNFIQERSRKLVV
jgi:hypothetical protein